MSSRISALSGIVLLASTVAALPEIVAASQCAPTQAPSATLLFPYFEVDLADPEGATTLISINAETGSGDPVLAHVVIWSDLGFPVLDFDLHLDADTVVSLDLRRVLQGELPETGPASGEISPFPACTNPLALPQLDAAAIASLQAALLGRPDPQDALCRAEPRDEGGLAIGYLTVDVLNECSETIRNPRDPGYFEPGGTGTASNRNVLWGDIFLVNQSEDSAQGLAAVGLVADAEQFGPDLKQTFYEGLVGLANDHRQPLGDAFRTRFLNGGAFTAGTDLVVWTEDVDFTGEPFDCTGPIPAFAQTFLDITVRNEKGTVTAEDPFFAVDGVLTSRRQVGIDPGFSTGGAHFGTIEIATWAWFAVPTLPAAFPIQSWVFPVLRAAGRYSVALEAVQTGCITDS